MCRGWAAARLIDANELKKTFGKIVGPVFNKIIDEAPTITVIDEKPVVIDCDTVRKE